MGGYKGLGWGWGVTRGWGGAGGGGFGGRGVGGEGVRKGWDGGHAGLGGVGRGGDMLILSASSHLCHANKVISEPSTNVPIEDIEAEGFLLELPASAREV